MQLALEWARLGFTVAYYSEEALLIWEERMRLRTDLPDGFNVVTALGQSVEQILADVVSRAAKVVIIDTVKLLGIRDTNDETQVFQALAPFINASRDLGATLIFVHHTRKAGGEHGLGVSGSHAFTAIVDVSIEIDWVEKQRSRRKVTGLARIVDVPEFQYVRTEGGEFEYLGDSELVRENELKGRFLDVLPSSTDEAMTRTELMQAIGDPKPSKNQADRVLKAMVEEGLVHRDPARKTQGATYRYSTTRGPVSINPRDHIA